MCPEHPRRMRTWRLHGICREREYDTDISTYRVRGIESHKKSGIGNNCQTSFLQIKFVIYKQWKK